MTEQRMIRVEIREWNPSGRGEYISYMVPVDGAMDVLNVLEYVRVQLDSSISYRSSCRRGICGGCLMTIDGKLRLACETEICDGMKIDPYRTNGDSHE